MVCVAVGTGHDSGVQHVTQVLLTHEDEAQEMPVFGAWVLLSLLEYGLLLEQGVGDYQSLFCTQSSSMRLLALLLPTLWPYSVVSSHSCVKVAHDDEL